MRWLALIAIAGCAQMPINAKLEDLDRARPQLTAGKSVPVQAHVDDDAEDDFETVMVGPSDVVTATIDREPVDLKIADLLKRCPNLDCNVDSPVTIGERRRMSNTTPAYIAGGVLVAGLVGSGVCAFECDRPWSLISDGVLITAGVYVILAVAAQALSNHPSVLLGPLFW